MELMNSNGNSLGSLIGAPHDSPNGKHDALLGTASQDEKQYSNGSDPLKIPFGLPFNVNDFSTSVADVLYSSPVGTISRMPHDLLSGGNAGHTPSTSPQTSSSAGSGHHQFPFMGALCGRCESNAISRCLDCNDMLCDKCVSSHRLSPDFADHCVTNLNNSPIFGSNIAFSNNCNEKFATQEPFCAIHKESLRNGYVCENCKTIICQECMLLGEHKDHSCIPVKNVTEGARDKMMAIIESGKLGTKYIKAGIDRAVISSQAVERDASEITIRIRKAMRHFILAAEDRERVLLERVEKYRLQRLNILSDQMTGLRSALSGLATASENLNKALDMIHNMTPLDVASLLTKGEAQMERFAAMYKSLQPKEEFLYFLPPNFDLLQEIRTQGEVLTTFQKNPVLTSASVAVPPNPQAVRRNSVRSQHENDFEPIAPPFNNILSYSIPNCKNHVVVKPALGPTLTFGFDGHEDGQLSRAWGLCTDKDGNIIVADRRNNRIQVFSSDGSLNLKFGTKGSGNGQFDLPAGVSTDSQNQIVVADKDNHRVQVFTATGTFVRKFGSFGKECGQFQYPWDIAVNSKGEMLVTDSRNHRIQLFSNDGQFISRFTFDGVNHCRYLKGFTTPRGVCFTPSGQVLVTDFENHRLLLIDSGLTKIKAVKGHEGSGTGCFCRPSGICCDDDGNVIVADSKNQRVLIFTPQLEFLWAIEIKSSFVNVHGMGGTDDKDRPSDVALLPDGRLVIMVETSPDCRDQCSPQKTFIQIY
ncbi:LOW QUALITY PROTEIN: protein wech [Culicoides brevitarsis]|uniref:LOW QUALITY PROTEIN: protein wech n=1 Tax=Culicoides brevitarsis TaxID=469753 RepID=UPI00307C83B5